MSEERGKPDWQSRSDGAQVGLRKRRRFVHSVAGLLALALAAVFVLAFQLLTPKNPAIGSVAIMPLLNASSDPDAEYLSDGITESVINSLSQAAQLRVMARSTVFRYKGREVDPREIGRDLGVGAVLMGRVLQRKDTVVVQTELIDASTVNSFLVDPNPSPVFSGSGGGSPFERIRATFKKMDEDEIPFQIEKWTTSVGSKVYLIYNTMYHEIFITGIDPATVRKRK
ncbi:MAG: hypothetical protein HY650_08665 [Acidobacteria bacterium]|nr:hypothetical protein [Acidobacteriota bacterium]